MNKGAFIIIVLLTVSLRSWGSVALPQLSYKALRDTIPAQKPVVETQTSEQKPVETIIKEVPKAKKQLKPIAVPPTGIPVKPPVIIKPKIVIKKIGLHV
jgi:hypothetical protein